MERYCSKESIFIEGKLKISPDFADMIAKSMVCPFDLHSHWRKWLSGLDLSTNMRKKIGEILIEAGVVTKEQIAETLAIQRTESAHKIGSLLVRLGYVKEEQIAEALSEKLNLPLVRCGTYHIPNELKVLVPKDLARKEAIFPLELRKGTLVIAMADPLDYGIMDDLSFRTKLRISPVVSYESSILRAIEKNYTEDSKDTNGCNGFEVFAAEAAEKDIQFLEGAQKDDNGNHANIEELYTQSQAPTTIKLVATLISEAVKTRASDIHLEPQLKHINVKFRIDGDLRTIFKYKRSIHDSVVSRIKIIANLDITNRHLPQDGSTRVSFQGDEIDLRISTLPAIYGEKVVIRVLNQSVGIIPLGELGMPDHILESVIEIFKSPQGMFIVTGPTGSGKTTTLYASINQLRSDTKNIITIEDPVEYKLEGITQVQVKEAIGRTFAAVLRSVLRQDPDVIKVGEVRDLETAEIAIRAALTGHFVLTTLHTNSTIATITRLADIGVAPFLLSSAISGILAQRLVRKVCQHCKEKSPAPEYLLGVVERLGLPELTTSHSGKGCHRCHHTGYLGRVAVYEFLPLTKSLSRLVARNAPEQQLLSTARDEGVTFLFEDAWNKVKAGVTTAEEVLGKIPMEHMRGN